MVFIRTVTAFSFTVFSAIFFMPLALPALVLSLLGLKKSMSWVIYRLAQFWAIVIVILTGSSMDLKGRENIPKKGGVCFVSNHVGIFDIILALAYIGRPFGFIAKKELLFLPFFNVWIYLLGGLFIDRKNVRKARKTIEKAIRKIRKGNGMLIFQEGTRSKGRGLLPFRSGAFRLASNSLAPIVPIAISGSYEVFEKNYRVHPASVKMQFFPPIVTENMSSEDRKHKLPDDVYSIIQSAL